MKITIYFCFIFLINLAHAEQGIQRDGFLEKTDKFFGKITNFARGVHCKAPSRAEYNTVDCQIKNYSILDSANKNNFEQMMDNLVFSETARAVYDMNKCQSEFFNAYEVSPSEKAELQDRAYDQFKKVAPFISKKRAELWKASKDNILESAAVSGGTSLDMVNNSEIIKDRFDKKLAPIAKNLENLVTSIPMGNRPLMRSFLISSVEKNLGEEQFKIGFERVMKQLQAEANGSYQKMKKLSYVDPGGKHGLLFNIDNDTKRSFVENGLVQSVLVQNKLDKNLEDGLICRYDEKFRVGAMTRTGVEVLGSILIPYGATSMALRAGLIAARTGSATVRTAAIAANYLSKPVIFGVSAAQVGMTYIAIKQSCFPPEYLASKESQKCNAKKQFYEIRAEASIAGCLLNASLGVALPAAVVAHTVMNAKRAVESAEIVVTAVKKTSDTTDRLRRAQVVLGSAENPRVLSFPQNRAIMRAHNVGAAEGRVVGTYTPQDIAKKTRILLESGFTKKEARALMKNNVTGVALEPVSPLLRPIPDEDDLALLNRTPTQIAEDTLRSKDAAVLDNLQVSISTTEDFQTLKSRGDKIADFDSYRDQFGLRIETKARFDLENEMSPSPIPKPGMSFTDKLKKAITKKRKPEEIQADIKSIDQSVAPKLSLIIEQKASLNQLIGDSKVLRAELERKLAKLKASGVESDILFMNTPTELSTLQNQIDYLKVLEGKLELNRLGLDIGIKRAQTYFGEPVANASRDLIVRENLIISTMNLKFNPALSKQMTYIPETLKLKSQGFRTDPQFEAVVSRWVKDTSEAFDLRRQALLYKWKAGEGSLKDLLSTFDVEAEKKILDSIAADPNLVSLLLSDKNGLSAYLSFLGKNNKLLEAYGVQAFRDNWTASKNLVTGIIKSDTIESVLKLQFIEKIKLATGSQKIQDYMAIQKLAQDSALKELVKKELPEMYVKTLTPNSAMAKDLFGGMTSTDSTTREFTASLLLGKSDVPLLTDFKTLASSQNFAQAAILRVKSGNGSSEFQEAILSHVLTTVDRPVKIYDMFPLVKKDIVLKALESSKRFSVFDRQEVLLTQAGPLDASTRSIFEKAEPLSSQFIRLEFGVEMQTTPVTQLQWSLISGKNPSLGKNDSNKILINGEKISLDANRPVESISQEEAEEFVGRLSALDPEYDYRLPTSGELRDIGVRNPFELKVEPNYDQPASHNVAALMSSDKGFYSVNENVAYWTSDKLPLRPREEFYIEGTSFSHTTITGRRIGFNKARYKDVGLRLVRVAKIKSSKP